jgi:hypothetical protein
MESLLNLLFLVIWLLVMGHIILMYRAWRHLQLNHPTAWSALGSPSVFNLDPGIIFSAKKFLWSPERKALNDEKLNTLCSWSKLFGYSGGFFFMAFSLFILSIVIFH